VADWTVGLFFGRDGSELGRLGHPGRLDAPDQIALGDAGNGSGQSESSLAPAEDDEKPAPAAREEDAQSAPPMDSPVGD
jgi:NADH dehydrogenase